MRLEILVGSEEPLLFSLKKQKTLIGSDQSCDIQLSASGISRKHIAVFNENDNFYVIDQGSTNGTFINEERLVPGKRVEFTSFFPIRLGDNVLMSLLSDDESFTPEKIDFPKESSAPKKISSINSDTTTSINLRELQGSKTKELIRERNIKKSRAPKAKMEPSKKKKSVSFIQLLGVTFLCGAVYYHFFIRQTATEDVAISKVGEIVKEPVNQSKEPVKPKFEISEPTKLDALGRLKSDFKCVTDIEKYLCDHIQGAKLPEWGVTQVGTRLNIMLDGTYYLNESMKFFKNPPSDSELAQATVAYYIMNSLSLGLDKELLKGYSLNFGLFKKTEEGFVPFVSFNISIEALNELKPILNPEIINSIPVSGISVLDFTKDYYSII